MSGQFTIRAATGDDIGALALVGAATFLDGFAGILDGPALVAHCQQNHSEATYRRYLDKGASAFLAEAEGGAPVGYALVSVPELEAARDGDIELKRIYTLSRYHGSGMAAALLDAALEATTGYGRLLLGVKDDNHRAIAFYRKHGFEQIGTRRFDVGGRIYDDVVLARTLALSAARETL